MNALCSDLKVTLNAVRSTPESTKGKGPFSRERSVFIGLAINGTTRVGGGPGEWVVYVFIHPYYLTSFC